MKKKFVLLLITLAISTESLSQAGQLDSTFGNNGIASCCQEGGAVSVAISQDGKIICGGGLGIGSPAFALVRFNSEGKLDSSFGVNGINSVVVGSGYNSAYSIALQEDGKILISGSCVNNSGYWSAGLARFDANGIIDSSFSNDGKLTTTFFTSENNTGTEVIVQPDQKIIQVGRGQDAAGNNGFAVVRYNSDGALDNSFGMGGKVVTPIGNVYPYATCVAIQPDSKIVVGGFSSSVGIDPRCFALIRYNSDGTLDNSFGSNGKLISYIGGGDGSGETSSGLSIALQSDGKILITGESFLESIAKSFIPIIRYNSNGSLDSTFGNGGIEMTLDDSLEFGVRDMTLQQDDKIIVAGYSLVSNIYIYSFMLARYNINGIIDSSFGNNGILILTLDSTTQIGHGALSVALQDDGKIITVGKSGLGFTVFRILSGLNVGILNLTTSNAPPLIYPNPIQSTATLEYTLTQTQNITIKLYNLLGEVVQTFITNQNQNTGEHKEVLNFNEQILAGAYLLCITNGAHEQVVKVTLVR